MLLLFSSNYYSSLISLLSASNIINNSQKPGVTLIQNVAMTSRNLTEVFIIMRNNSYKNRNLYRDDRRESDAEKLLQHTVQDAEEGLEMRDDFGTPPIWIDKLEEAQYAMSKIKPKLDELGSLYARHLLRPAFDENSEDELQIEKLSQDISKLISSTHRQIQCIRSSLGVGSKIEQQLTKNVVTYLLLSLQDLTYKFRNSQNSYINQIDSREERSQKYFESSDFATIDLSNKKNDNFVDTFDNFLQPNLAGKSGSTSTYTFGDSETKIDEDFQRPVTNRMTQQQLLLFEEENTRISQFREQEVKKIVKSIYDLNDIFKDLAQMVQEQGTVLDRIDYNVEQTQTRVSQGLRQLQRAEKYKQKNRKMCAIMVLAGMSLFMMILLIFTKF